MLWWLLIALGLCHALMACIGVWYGRYHPRPGLHLMIAAGAIILVAPVYAILYGGSLFPTGIWTPMAVWGVAAEVGAWSERRRRTGSFRGDRRHRRPVQRLGDDAGPR